MEHSKDLRASGGTDHTSQFCSRLIRRVFAQLLEAVIIHRLLSAGDMERNPGPISGGAHCNTSNVWVISGRKGGRKEGRKEGRKSAVQKKK